MPDRWTTLLCAMGLAMLVACTGESHLTDAERVARAEVDLGRGAYAEAQIELRNALKRNPNNAQARRVLGQAELELGDSLSAEKEFEKALAGGERPQLVYPGLGQALLLNGKYREVISRFGEWFRTNRDTVRAADQESEGLGELAATIARAQISQRKVDDAVGMMADATHLAPASPYVAATQAQMLVAQGRPDDARQSLRELVEKHGTYGEAWRMLGDLAVGRDELEAAVEAYGKAIENEKDNSIDHLRRALALIRLERYDDAGADIRVLKQRNVPAADYPQGLVEFFTGDFKSALASLGAVLSADPDYQLAPFFAAVAHLKLGAENQAAELLKVMVQKQPNYWPARKMLAAIETRHGRHAKVEELLKPLASAGSRDPESNQLLADALLQQGKSAEALELLENAVRLAPDSSEARVSLGRHLLRDGMTDVGVKELRAATGLAPDSVQSDTILIMHYLREKRLDEALAVATEFSKRLPNNAIPHMMLARVYLARQDRDNARKALEQAIALEPSEPAARTLLAGLALDARRPDEARHHYAAVLSKYPSHLATLLRLSELERRANNPSAVESLLRIAVQAHPHEVAPALLLAQLLTQKGESEAALKFLAPHESRQGANPRYLLALGNLQFANGQTDQARDTLLKVQRLAPDSLAGAFYLDRALAESGDWRQAKEQATAALSRIANKAPDTAAGAYKLSRLYASSGDWPQTVTQLEKAIKLDAAYVPARLAYTKLLVAQGKHEAAAESLTTLRSLTGDSPDVKLIEGALASAKGDWSRAEDTFAEVFSEVKNTETVLALAHARRATGDKAGGLALLERWVEDNPDDLKARFGLAQTYLREGDREKAIVHYRGILDASPDSVVALNNLAGLLKTTAKNEALQFARKARELSPNSPAVLDTLADVLIANGELGEAKSIVAQGLKISKSDPNLTKKQRMLDKTQGGQRAP